MTSRMTVVLAGLVVVGFQGASAQTAWYVANGGSDADGLSWGTAYSNLQTAVNNAVDGDVIHIRNSLLLTNTVSGVNACVAVAGGTVAIENATMVTNPPVGIRRTGGTVTARNTILWANGVDSTGAVTIIHSCVSHSSDYTDGGGNQWATDPMFRNAAGNDYRLHRESPAIDVGINQPWMTGATDRAGNKRILHGGRDYRVDMGAYEADPWPGTVLGLR